MDIIVNDTNIFIDMFSIGLLETMCDLPFEIHTVDFVIDEITNIKQRSSIKKLIDKKRIHVQSFTADEIGLIVSELSGVSGNLSLTDCSACYYARKNSLKLITGDKQLRNYAIKWNVEVHGILFLFEQLVENSVITPSVAAKKPKELLVINTRLPQSEIAKRITAWENRD